MRQSKAKLLRSALYDKLKSQSLAYTKHAYRTIKKIYNETPRTKRNDFLN